MRSAHRLVPLRHEGGGAISILDNHVSTYRDVQDTTGWRTHALGAVLDRIATGAFADDIAALRHCKATEGEDAYKRAKTRLPSFTPCCTLRTRDKAVKLADKLLTTTGIVHFDFDRVEDPDALKAQLCTEPSLVFAFVSPGGDGLKTGFAADGITDGPSYRRAWHQVKAHLHATFPDTTISEDPQIKYVNALCFVSADRETYINPDAVPLVISPGSPPAGGDPPDDPDPVPGEDAIPFPILAQAVWSIPCEDYAPWLTVGMALHASGYPQARTLWEAWSQQSAKYDQAAQDTKWASFRADGGTHPGDLLTLAHQHGWRPAGWGTQGQTPSSNGHATGDAGNYFAITSQTVRSNSPREIRASAITSLTSLTSQERKKREGLVLQPEALSGLAGDIVRAIDPHTEADPAAVLAQLLTVYGIAIGRQRYAIADGVYHYGNLFTVIAGLTARSRKGTSYAHVERCIHQADPTWGLANHIKGAGSGEGLIFAVRDERWSRQPIKEKGRIVDYQEVLVDCVLDTFFHLGGFGLYT